MLLLTPGALHYTRCPLSYPVRVGVWLWVWMSACVALSAGQGVGQGTILQDFPIAAEENFYSFNPDGTYTFSYDTGGGKHQSFRIEMRDASGRVSGRYGYVDPAGALRITEYQADSSGYRASIEVYHQVSLAPPTPLLVGPLPKQPISIPGPVEGPSKPPVMRPVGPVPFFPPQQPVLIIGPLPKPLQPQSNEVDQDPPDLNEDSLFTIPSDPLVPAVLPNSPLADALPTETFDSPQGDEGSSIQQGILTDILHQSSDDFVSPNRTVTDHLQAFEDLDSLNSTVTISTIPTENVNQLESAVENGGQMEASSNAQADQQLPEELQVVPHQIISPVSGQIEASNSGQVDKKLPDKLQVVPSQNSSPVTQQKHNDINPTKTNLEESGVNNVPGVAVHAAQGNSVNEKPRLQPSAPTILTSTMFRLAERGAKTEITTAITASPVLVTEEDDNTRSQSRPFHNLHVPPTPPLTYLPVGAPRHQYPTAPLLHLPREANSYPS